jgi:hypothetical protein
MPMASPKTIEKVSLLKRREIEASMAVALVKGYREILGEEAARPKAQEVIETMAMEAGRSLSGKENSLADFLNVVQKLWCQDGALEIEVISLTDRDLSFNVWRCRYAEMYAQMGFKEYGSLLSCSRDRTFISGFNPRMKISRTQTIMEDAAFCDFRIKLG